MNKILPKLLFSVSLLFLAMTAGSSVAYAAASLQFDQTSLSVAQNATFQLKVNINVETSAALGSDAIINFAGADLDIQSVTNGGFFPEFNSANNTSGRLELHGYTSATNDSRTGNGTLATIVLKAKKGSGSSAITFTCTGSGNDTNILNTGGTNILNCSQTNTTGVSFTGTGINSPTPTTIGNTPTPTTAGGGNTSPQCASLYTDISSATGTPQTVSLTCSGIDTGGYINAAEFVFGDGTSQIVEKNAGSPGSIATTHSYTTIGTLGTSCRVRDNDNVWSTIPENCRKLITIRPRTATPTPTRTYGIATPTPTTIIAELISETPEPTVTLEQTPTVEPTLYPENPEDTSTKTSSSNIWWIIGGIIAIILAFLLLRRKKPQDNPPQYPPQYPQSPPSVAA